MGASDQKQPLYAKRQPGGALGTPAARALYDSMVGIGVHPQAAADTIAKLIGPRLDQPSAFPAAPVAPSPPPEPMTAARLAGYLQAQGYPGNVDNYAENQMKRADPQGAGWSGAPDKFAQDQLAAAARYYAPAHGTPPPDQASQAFEAALLQRYRQMADVAPKKK